ncbi:MAG: hypothetical protein A2W97_13070 [Bacteroidetes bacterium GWE2_40_63]|nr:MAG: hypothetical protein A2W96_15930 [Bacteroidetes bacterium GWD2_40_43]OFX89658.1 MAG: hypothetical protein A2W97_13070 [Bacteroidetes bacterium GWE2_40_63]OFY24202.1 MAG: hypothetical protein A2W88_14505 [Bacteroidetes bacterium GWF2_40_13]OFZ26396.1 MAG: hypothetical protein A2437_03420 [Bacteroidetes bacterium RIFOXYC2_FULL_40_12]
MQYQVTATIVTFNNDHSILRKTIDSFLETTMECFLYIVDNSPNRSIESLCNDDKIEYIFAGCNKGFGFGHNIILRQKEKLGKYHLILNPDIVIPKGVLEELVGYYENNPEIGMLTPRIFFPDDTIQYLPKILPIPLNLIIRFLPFLQPFFRKRADNYILKNAKYDEPFKIGILSGCFMLVKTDKLKDHLFDERFFMYFEDVDFSRRIGMENDLVMYPFVHVYHDYGRGAHQSYFLFKIFLNSLLKYFNKWGWVFDGYRRQKNKKIIMQFNGK